MLVEKMISSNRMVNVLTGEKRKGLNKIEKEARKKAKEYYGDPLRRDKEREQEAAMDGAFDDIVRERDEALEERDEWKAITEPRVVQKLLDCGCCWDMEEACQLLHHRCDTKLRCVFGLTPGHS